MASQLVQSQCARTAQCPNTLNLDVQVHLDVCPGLLLPDLGAFIVVVGKKLTSRETVPIKLRSLPIPNPRHDHSDHPLSTHKMQLTV